MTTAPRVGRRRRVRGHVARLLACALLLGGCTGDEAPLVEVERVTTGAVTSVISAPGRVDAAARQDVTSTVSGVVVGLDAADGGEVTAGQTVVRLASSQVDLALQQAQAAQSATDAVGGIELGAGAAATIASTQDAVDRLDARSEPPIAAARAEAEKIVDPGQRAAAEAAIAAVERSYRETRAGVLAAGHALADQQQAAADALADALNAAIAQATAAQRLQADAAAALAVQQAEGLSVVAPFAGTIALGSASATDGGAAAALGALSGGVPDLAGLAGSLPAAAGGEGGGTLRVGAPVGAGQTLFTVYDLSARYVLADVDEIDAPDVAVGQEALVLVDAFPDAVFAGVVELVAVEAATTAAGGVGYPTRVRITGPAPEDGGDAAAALPRLRIGSTASVEIRTATTDAALVVPSRALVQRDGATVVFVLRDGRVQQVPVEVGTLGDDRAEVSGDLRVDDEVVVTGYEELADGDAVRTGG